MTDTRRTYNRKAIYELLLAAFTAEQLQEFCRIQPGFEPLLTLFGPKYNLRDMAGEVMDYCREHGLWDELLEGVKEHNSYQYGEFEDRLHEPETARDNQAYARERRQPGIERDLEIQEPRRGLAALLGGKERTRTLTPDDQRLCRENLLNNRPASTTVCVMPCTTPSTWRWASKPSATPSAGPGN